MISFTPGFSQVFAERESAGNRLNGFLKLPSLLLTWLKPGVNENAFEAKHRTNETTLNLNHMTKSP